MMSELQIGLLGIGAIVVIGVYGYGFWQQRQYRGKFAATFKTENEDALYRSTPEYRPVPEIKNEAAELIEEEVAQIEHVVQLENVVENEPVTQIEQLEPQPESLTSGEIDKQNFLDETMDYIVSITPKSPLGSDALAPLWGLRFDFGKRVYACGLNTRTRRWERLIPESNPSYSVFNIGLQLADRSGVVSQIRMTDFCEVLREIAEKIQAEIVMPDMSDAIKKANKLDEFCAEVDQMIGLNILLGAERHIFASDVAQLAEQQGMALQADGTFHLIDAQGQTRFSLSSIDGALFQHHTLTQMRLQGLTLLLDVPRVTHPAEQFDAMAASAQKLADELNASLVDDHRVALSAAALTHIHEQVAVLEARMLAGNIIPGSAQALRLFS